RSLRHALDGVPAGDPAVADARHQRRRGIGLHRVIRRFHHHPARRGAWSDDPASVHLGPHARSVDARDQLHEHHSLGHLCYLRFSIVPHRKTAWHLKIPKKVRGGNRSTRLKLFGRGAAAAMMLSALPAMAGGELHIYNWGDYTNPKLIEKFQKETGIKVTL